MNTPYDYEAKGREDFAAGRKDERLYGGPDKHNADYRRGWQSARRAADGPPLGAAAPVSAGEGQGSGPKTDPAKGKETPGEDLPPFEDAPIPARPPKPEDWNGSKGSVSIVQPVEDDKVPRHAFDRPVPPPAAVEAAKPPPRPPRRKPAEPTSQLGLF